MKLFVIVVVASLCCAVYAAKGSQCAGGAKEYHKNDFTSRMGKGTEERNGNNQYEGETRVRVAFKLDKRLPFSPTALQVRFEGASIGRAIFRFKNETWNDKKIILDGDTQVVTMLDADVDDAFLESIEGVNKVVVEARRKASDDFSKDLNVQVVDLKACPAE